MRTALLATTLVTLLAAGCGGDGTEAPAPGADPDSGSLALTSPAFDEGDELPPRFTCDGRGQAPVLEWSGVPDDAQSLAILVDDPDAPGGDFVHWSVWGLAPQIRTLVGEGPLEGKNDFGKRGYGPPCPPKGDGAHTYRFTLHVLDGPLPLRAGAPGKDVRERLEERSIDSATLEARYSR